ncbi:MAG: acyl--CoA ligase [Lachnospiraceae bacterium]|nr:acyl--CoA ligase [Lachnospiraceae bacterium]
MTGYASKDKPWIKYYPDNWNTKKYVKRTVYEELISNNKDNKSVAIRFFGTKITFPQFIKNVNRTASAFASIGIKKGDYVTICSVMVPEVAYSFYGLAKIGAVCNFMSPYFDKDQMIDRINECNSKVLLVLDTIYTSIHETIEKMNMDKIIVVPTLNASLLGIAKKKVKIQENDMYWNDFVKGANEDVNIASYEENMACALVYSSGSTGASKAILLSHDSFQNSVHAYEQMGINVNGDQRFYQIIPPWYSTGLSTSMHLPLSHGAEVLMDPRFERKIFVNNCIKFKPNSTVAPTSMYEGFLNSTYVKNKKIQGLDNVFQGGERLELGKKKSINDVWKSHGCESELMVGYGQCECGAGIASQTIYTDNNKDSVGIPLPGVIVSIFDDDCNELTYNTLGNIFVATQCGMVEYYQNEQATNEYFYTDSDGIKWSRTGDVGCMDEDGNLYVKGRAVDYSVINGVRFYNFIVEQEIMKLSYIENCDVFCMSHNGKEKLSAHLVFSDNPDINTINSRIEEIVSKLQVVDPEMVPQIYKIWDVFPNAKSGKRDVDAMKHSVDGIITL